MFEIYHFTFASKFASILLIGLGRIKILWCYLYNHHSSTICRQNDISQHQVTVHNVSSERRQQSHYEMRNAVKSVYVVSKVHCLLSHVIKLSVGSMLQPCRHYKYKLRIPGQGATVVYGLVLGVSHYSTETVDSLSRYHFPVHRRIYVALGGGEMIWYHEEAMTIKC